MIKDIKKILYILGKKDRKRSYLLIIAAIIMAIFEVFSVASIMPFIAIIANENLILTQPILFNIYNFFNISSTKIFITLFGSFSFLLFVLSLSIKAITTYLQIIFLQNTEYRLSKRIFECYLNQPYAWFLNRNSSVLGKNILSEVNTIINYGLLPLITIISQTIVFISIFILVIIVNPITAFAIISILGSLYILIYKIFSRFLKRIGAERSDVNTIRFKLLNEAFNASKVVKLLGLENSYISRFNPIAKRYAMKESYLQGITQLPRYIVEIVAFGGIQILIILIIISGKNFNNALPLISLYVFSGYRLMPAIQQIYNSFAQFRYVSMPLDNFYKDFLNLSFQKQNKSEKKLFTFKNSIKLENISFKYSGTNVDILKDINIEISKKEKVGLVGTTGSGKTTTIDIILGLLSPSDGILKVDNQPINKKNIRSWQNILGYVPQDIYISDETIAENIAFGIKNEDINYKAIEKASKIANLHQFVINELPNGYETIVGERGIRLSGGQRQRIGIARALYHNPKILILDEATSSLDNITEKAVMEAVNNLSREMTLILIAHRLSTVKNCDIIFYLEKGKLLAKGNYDELKRKVPAFEMMSNY